MPSLEVMSAGVCQANSWRLSRSRGQEQLDDIRSSLSSGMLQRRVLMRVPQIDICFCSDQHSSRARTKSSKLFGVNRRQGTFESRIFLMRSSAESAVTRSCNACQPSMLNPSCLHRAAQEGLSNKSKKKS